jgi:hypothetical protein
MSLAAMRWLARILNFWEGKWKQARVPRSHDTSGIDAVAEVVVLFCFIYTVRSMGVIAGPGGEYGDRTHHGPISPLTLRYHYDIRTILHSKKTCAVVKQHFVLYHHVPSLHHDEPATRYEKDYIHAHTDWTTIRHAEVRHAEVRDASRIALLGEPGSLWRAQSFNLPI